MDIKAKSGNILKEKSNAAVLTAFEGEKPSGLVAAADKATGGMVTRAIESGEFTGKTGETLLLHTAKALPGGPDRLLVVGLGKKDKCRPDGLMRAAGTAATSLRGIGAKDIAFAVIEACGNSVSGASMQIAQGAMLGLYGFDTFKSPDPKKKVVKRATLVVTNKADAGAAKEGVARGIALAESVCFARDMINAPANEMTPSVMAGRAKKMAREFGIKCKVLERDDCRKLGMGAFLGVASGSVQPPKFIIMEYNRAKGSKKPTVLVGKAITFDSGGISIKPVDGMEKMKYDMAGGAAVIATMRAAAALKLPVNLVGLVPASENLPSGSAYKPGDVVKAMNGKTVEIISTDAEGRMVLSDALCYAQRYKPEAVIDIATLTGACVIALGDLAIGLMGNNAKLIANIRDAGDSTMERLWELPMWDEYLERMKGDVSDLKNVGGRQAATVTAGKFLQEFVGDFPWAHLDIAGTAWEEKGQPYIPKGARGTGVRLLIEYLTRLK